MRIAQVTSSLLTPLGGAEQYLLALSRWQHEQGHEVTVITGWISPEVELALVAEGIAVRVVRSRRPYPPDRKGSKPAAALFHALDLIGGIRTPGPMRRALAEGWDAIHVHRFAGFGAALLGSPAPVVMTVHDYGLVDTTTTLLRHGREVDTAPWLQRLRTRIVSRAIGGARLVFPTERLRAGHARWGLTLPTRTEVIAHGWRIDGAAGFTAVEPAVDGPTVFLFLGKLIREKGVELLLEAWGDGIPGAELWIAGAGELRPAVESAAAAGLVRDLGWLDDAGRRSALAAASVLVLPSVWPENFPLAAAEGVLAGLPLVSTTIAAPPVLHPDGNGLLAEPDAESLRAHLVRLTDPELAARLAAGSREMAGELDFDVHGRRILDLYSSLGAPVESATVRS